MGDEMWDFRPKHGGLSSYQIYCMYEQHFTTPLERFESHGTARGGLYYARQILLPGESPKDRAHQGINPYGHADEPNKKTAHLLQEARPKSITH